MDRRNAAPAFVSRTKRPGLRRTSKCNSTSWQVALAARQAAGCRQRSTIPLERITGRPPLRNAATFLSLAVVLMSPNQLKVLSCAASLAGKVDGSSQVAALPDATLPGWPADRKLNMGPIVAESTRHPEYCDGYSQNNGKRLSGLPMQLILRSNWGSVPKWGIRRGVGCSLHRLTHMASEKPR